MLRLVDPNKHHSVTILDTEFQMRSMSVREKFGVIEQLGSLQPTTASYDKLIEQLCSVIVSVDGKETKDVLNALESFDDILAIINGVIEYCSLKDEQSKNSDSSSDTSIPTPTGN